ncbi:SOS response-associated peptidase [Roseiconus lacunae]|uniref:Abasic site processing protein n=1 Tax=Roseiconus lacunae TaxID=2605694 RepID=A0ABT7PBG4_9BACT|nr:SOS response-associated peptidase [Roseiconus lacunae]MDM4013825.1 SOS response-associated peptidase [Roseiconus lacunae]
MCGRFNLKTPAAAWTQEFLPLWSEQEIADRTQQLGVDARYNIAPTQSVSCICAADVSDQDDRRQWSLFRWGLVPFWAKDIAIGNRMINARSETAHEKRSFKTPLVRRRCLVPADGYYEWKKTGNGKQPYVIESTAGDVLAMAGLWEVNQALGTDGTPLQTVTILTTAANKSLSQIHDRMPVLIKPQDFTQWLDPQNQAIESVLPLLKPAEEDAMTARPVSTVVNNARNDVPECLQAPDV